MDDIEPRALSARVSGAKHPCACPPEVSGCLLAHLNHPASRPSIQGRNIKDVGPVPVVGVTEDTKIPHHPILAQGAVRYVGEPIAAVVANDRYVARDGADRVQVEYEPLPAVVDMEKALEPGSPKVHEEFDSNLAFTMYAGENVGRGA